MEYTDDGDSESELLGPIQESQQVEDPSYEPDVPAELPPSYTERGMHQDDSRDTNILLHQAACSGPITNLN